MFINKGIIKFNTSWEKLVPLNLFCLMMLLWFHSLKSSYGGISLLTHPTVKHKSQQLRSGSQNFPNIKFIFQVVLLIYGPFLAYFLSSSLLFFINICIDLSNDASPIFPITLAQYAVLVYWAGQHHPLINTAFQFKKGLINARILRCLQIVRVMLWWFCALLFFVHISRVFVEMGMYFVYWAHYSDMVQVDIGLWGLVPKVAREIFYADIVPFYLYVFLNKLY